MRKRSAWKLAFGGLMAALSMVIMCLGTLIPIATFVCPVLCCMIGSVVMRLCGKRIAFAWYMLLGLLLLVMCPDKEAAIVYILFGYYPMLKPIIDRARLRILLKFLYFNLFCLTVYLGFLHLFGLSTIIKEYAQLGIAGLVFMLIFGNVTFFLLDFLLKRIGQG